MNTRLVSTKVHMCDVSCHWWRMCFDLSGFGMSAFTENASREMRESTEIDDIWTTVRAILVLVLKPIQQGFEVQWRYHVLVLYHVHCTGSLPKRTDRRLLAYKYTIYMISRHLFWEMCESRLHRVQYLVWSRLLCNVPFFDPKHKLVWIGQFANIGTRIPGTSGNTSTVGVIRDAKATWNNLNFPDALLAKKRF